MSTERSEFPEHEQRLGEIAFAYVHAAETGGLPDKERFMAQHPEFAAELAEFFAGRDKIDGVAAPLRQALQDQPPASPAAAVAAPNPLGDFRLIRQVGRGGMGIVYEAEQVSLGRRVALKVLPFAATMDPKQLQRFKNEAQAAAQLHHTNIVPVYYVGCERGVHFYAMQYIDGQTLAAVIHDLRQTSEPGPTIGDVPMLPAHGGSVATAPTAGLSTQRSPRDSDHFRAVARLGMQAAEALEYAHQEGIVHRDIKPANLLLDAKGKLWITDFGLACFAGDPRLTMTGDLVGTLRYMSPEQALGKRALVDHRTDIYSLGVTLYELLTLAPAFPESDRQALLKQLATDEPKPPRRLNSAIPVELETILLKAVSKEPNSRYATAQALSDDLKNFLEYKPIRARRPTLWEKLRKWARRHRGVVATAIAAAIVLLLFAVVALAVGNLLIGQERAEALHQRDEAATQRNEADKQRALADERAEVLRLQLYAADMSLAHRAWQRRDLDALDSLISRYEGADDLCGFEWHYLRRLAQARPRPLRTLEGHKHIVYCATYSPDGQIVASGGADCSIRLWDVPSGTCRAELTGHTTDVNSLSFSPDGRQLASASDDGTIRLWDARNGRAIGKLQNPTPIVHCAVFSPDGKMLASGGKDRIVRLWNVARQKVEAEFPGHEDDGEKFGGISALAYSPDGKTLVSAGGDGYLRFWDPSGRRALREFCLGRPVYCVAYSPDGRYIATADRLGWAHLHRSQDGQYVTGGIGGHDGRARCVAFSHDSAFLASSGDDGHVCFYSVLQRRLQEHFQAHDGIVWCVNFAPSTNAFVTAGSDHKVRLWERPQELGNLLSLKTDTGPGTRGAFLGNNRLLAAWAPYKRLELWDWKAGHRHAEHSLLHTQSEQQRLAATFDGRILAIADEDGNVRLHACPSFRELRCLLRPPSPAPGYWLKDLCFSCDARWLCGVYGDGTLRVWKLIGGTDQYVDIQLGEVGWLAASPTGTTLAIIAPSGLIRWWDLDRQSWQGEPIHGPAMTTCVEFSPNGKVLALSGADRRIWLLDVQTGSIHELEGHLRKVSCVAFAPDGRTLASSSSDGSVRLWHVATRQEMFAIHEDGRASLNSVAFSPDGKALAVGGYRPDEGSKVWFWLAGEP